MDLSDGQSIDSSSFKYWPSLNAAKMTIQSIKVNLRSFVGKGR